MGRTVYLGAEGGATIHLTPDGKTITWSVPQAAPNPVQLWVSRDKGPNKLQAGARTGVNVMEWVTAGSDFRWELTAGADNRVIAQLFASTKQGFPVQIKAVTVAPPPPPPPVELNVPPVELPGVQEKPLKVTDGLPFLETELVPGVPTPLLLGGVALGALLLLKKRK